MRILVTTDFSTNSKGAIRFVHTLAKQYSGIDVVFYHAVEFLKPTRWSKSFFESYKNDEISRLLTQLEKFALSVIGKDKNKFASVNFEIDTGMSTEKSIIRYAEANKVDYICIATQGAGVLRKIVGTHSGHIINHSTIPVLVIPSHYRSKPLQKATYLSDFENVKKEISKVFTFTKSLNIGLELLHFSAIVADKEKVERNTKLMQDNEYKSIKINIVENNVLLSMVENVSQYVGKAKPELLIMFTKKERGFFESIFVPSKSVELTYTTKVPVLIFSK